MGLSPPLTPPNESPGCFCPLNPSLEPLALIEPGDQPGLAAAVGIVLVAELRPQQRLFRTDAREEPGEDEALYRGLMRITRTVVRQAETTMRRARSGSPVAELAQVVELVRQVLAQTRARVLRGDTHYPGKVVSLFEPHTDIIRKGKVTKPTEFGRLVKILSQPQRKFLTARRLVSKRPQGGTGFLSRRFRATAREATTGRRSVKTDNPTPRTTNHHRDVSRSRERASCPCVCTASTT
jgi:hypothetical protein